VQFFAVVVEVSQKMTTTSGQSLEDEIEDENRERKFIERMNADFYSFVKQTEDIMHKSVRISLLIIMRISSNKQ